MAVLATLFALIAMQGSAQNAPPTAPSPVPAPGAKLVKQIRVTGADADVRAAFTILADQLQDELRRLFEEPDSSWIYPIEIQVSGSPQDVVTGRTAVIPPINLLATNQFELRLLVRLHNRYDQIEVKRELLRIFLYEMMLRRFAEDPGSFSRMTLDVPPWLLRGLEELMRYRAAGRPSDLYAGIIQSREILSVSTILGQKDQSLDPVTDAIFAASSAALVATLLKQENGVNSFRLYLAGLAQPVGSAPPDPETLLREHFPGLRGSAGALEKWWSLEIATMGQLQAVEFYTVEQTETLLDEALSIELPAEPVEAAEGIRKFLPQANPEGPFTGRIHDFPKFLSHKQAIPALENGRLKLRALSLRAFPLYRPLLQRYEVVVSRLIEDKTRGIEDDLKRLDQERQGIHQSMERVTDYMNYYEATRAEGRSEAYEQYRQIREKLERQGTPPRNDRITKYLDALEAEFATP